MLSCKIPILSLAIYFHTLVTLVTLVSRVANGTLLPLPRSAIHDDSCRYEAC